MNYPPGAPDLMTALADDGYSDFVSDYAPDDDQLIEWFTDDPEGVISTIQTYPNMRGLLDAAWCDTHEEELQKEWETK